jgi:Na+/H+-dicarboxylate symporter
LPGKTNRNEYGMNEVKPVDTTNHSFPVLPIVLAVILGIVLGHFAPYLAVKIKIIGTIFLNLLFVLVIPLIISSMITGISGLGDIRHVGNIGLKTIVYYLTTTFLSVVTGIILVVLIAPGKGLTGETKTFPDSEYEIFPTPISGGSIVRILDPDTSFNINIDPSKNRVELIDQRLFGIIDPDGAIKTKEIPVIKWLDSSGKKTEPRLSGTGIGTSALVKRLSGTELMNNYIPRNIVRSMVNENIFPLILFSLVFGGVLSTVGEAGIPLLNVFNAMNVTIIKCVMLLMYTAPLGIFGLTAGSIGEAELTLPGGFITELIRLAKYAITVLSGLLIHGGITLFLILAIFGKRNPFRFFKNMIPQILTAFSTASSIATLPVSLSLATKKNNVSERIASFVLPIGATVNMDGTALYEGVAAIFIAQIYGIPLGIFELVIIVLTATIASIGAAAIPQAGLVTLVVVMKSVGLPVEGIGMILSIDWFIDRFRTSVNVWGDVIGSAVIDRFEGNIED